MGSYTLASSTSRRPHLDWMIQTVQLIHDSSQVPQAVSYMLGAVNPDASLFAQSTHLRTDSVLLH